jgi:hypothetical protein
MSTGVNIGDIIFQLVSIGIPIFVVYILFSYLRNSKRKKAQLDRIEQKLNSLDNK